MKFLRYIVVAITLTGGLVFIPSVKAANILLDNPITQAAKNPISITPEVPIPGLFDKKQDITNSSIGTYIRAIYIYFIWIVGVLSVVMVTYGGIRWVAAAGNAARINDARETINNAIIGLIIALTSYTLLNIINPNFLKLQAISPGVQTGQQLSLGRVTALCQMFDKVNCGDTLVIGKMPAAAGATPLNSLCMGTWCQDKKSVCVLKEVTNASGQKDLASDGGCVAKVPDQTGANLVAMQDVRPGSGTQTACGTVSWPGGQPVFGQDPNLGNWCYADGVDRTDCTIIDKPAQTEARGNTGFEGVKNAFCPNKDSYNYIITQ